MNDFHKFCEFMFYFHIEKLAIKYFHFNLWDLGDRGVKFAGQGQKLTLELYPLFTLL